MSTGPDWHPFSPRPRSRPRASSWRRALLIVLMLGLSGVVHAQNRPAFLDPSLAISVEADQAELSQENNVSIYRGNVRLERGPLTMRGDELRIRRDPDSDRITAELSGEPADAEYRDPANPQLPVTAAARRIVYTTISEILELRGGARITRGDDSLTGESVRYDIPLARIRADGEDGDRVRIVINPPADARP